MHVIFAESVSNLQNWQFLQNDGEFLGKFCALYLFCTHFLFTWLRNSIASEEVKLLLEIQQNPTSFFKWMEKSFIHVVFRKNEVKQFLTEHFSFSSIRCVFTKKSLVKAVCHPIASIVVVSVKSPSYWNNNVQRVPALRVFWDLEKTVLHEICVSGTVLWSPTNANSPIYTYIFGLCTTPC